MRNFGMEGKIWRFLEILRKVGLWCQEGWKVGEEGLVESIAEERRCQSSPTIDGARRRRQKLTRFNKPKNMQSS